MKKLLLPPGTNQSPEGQGMGWGWGTRKGLNDLAKAVEWLIKREKSWAPIHPPLFPALSSHLNSRVPLI